MTLAEALAIEHVIGRIGYPNKADKLALNEARNVIQRAATEAVDRHWNTSPQGLVSHQSGHSGATESTGAASSDAAVRPANSQEAAQSAE